MQKFKVSSQLVPKIQWKQTDSRTEVIALPAALMRSLKLPNTREVEKIAITANKSLTCSNGGLPIDSRKQSCY